MNAPGLVWGLRAKGIPDPVGTPTFDSISAYSDVPVGIALFRNFTPDPPGAYNLKYNFWFETRPGPPSRLRANETPNRIYNLFKTSIVSDVPGEITLGQVANNFIFTSTISARPSAVILKVEVLSPPGDVTLFSHLVPDAPGLIRLEGYSGDVCPGNETIAVDTSLVDTIVYEGESWDTNKISGYCKDTKNTLYHEIYDYCNLKGECDWESKPGDHQVLIRISGACHVGRLYMSVIRIVSDPPAGIGLAIGYIISDKPDIIDLDTGEILSDVTGVLKELGVGVIVPDKPVIEGLEVPTIVSDKPGGFIFQFDGATPDAPSGITTSIHSYTADLPPTSGVSIGSIISDKPGVITFGLATGSGGQPLPIIPDKPGVITFGLATGSGGQPIPIIPDKPGKPQFGLATGSGGQPLPIISDKPGKPQFGLATGSGGQPLPIISDVPGKPQFGLATGSGGQPTPIIPDAPGKPQFGLATGSGGQPTPIIPDKPGKPQFGLATGSGGQPTPIISDKPGAVTGLGLATGSGGQPAPIISDKPGAVTGLGRQLGSNGQPLPIISDKPGAVTGLGLATGAGGQPAPIISDKPGTVTGLGLATGAGGQPVPIISDEPGAIIGLRLATGSGSEPSPVVSDKPGVVTGLGLGSGSGSSSEPIVSDKPGAPTITVGTLTSGAPGAPVLQLASGSGGQPAPIVSDKPGQTTQLQLLSTGGSNGITPDPVFNNQPPTLQVSGATSEKPGPPQISVNIIISDRPGYLNGVPHSMPLVAISTALNPDGSLWAITPDPPAVIGTDLLTTSIESDKPSTPVITVGVIDPDLPQVPGVVTLTVSSIESILGAPTLTAEQSTIVSDVPGAPIILTNAGQIPFAGITPDPTLTIEITDIIKDSTGWDIYYTATNFDSVYYNSQEERIKYQVIYDSSTQADEDVSYLTFNPNYDTTKSSHYVHIWGGDVASGFDTDFSVRLLLEVKADDSIAAEDTYPFGGKVEYTALWDTGNDDDDHQAITYRYGKMERLGTNKSQQEAWDIATQTGVLVPLYYNGDQRFTWNDNAYVNFSESTAKQWTKINDKVHLFRQHQGGDTFSDKSGDRHMMENRLLATVKDVDRAKNPVVLTVRNGKTTAYYRANDDWLYNINWEGGSFTSMTLNGNPYTGTVTVGTTVNLPTPIGGSSYSTDFEDSCFKVEEWTGETSAVVNTAIAALEASNYTVIAIEPSSGQSDNYRGSEDWDLKDGWSTTLLDGMLELTRRGV
jgi:hypothetical protein